MMLQLGDFAFEMNSAAYDQLQRSSSYRWPAQERINREPALQFVGLGTESIDLQGVIVPAERGGLVQVDRLRMLAGAGLPRMLVDGRGNVHGLWVLEQIEEAQAYPMRDGAPRRIGWRLRIRRYGA